MRKIILGFLFMALSLAGCHKDGKERFIVDQFVLIRKEAGYTTCGQPPYKITAIFYHAIKHDDAEYTILSSDGVVTQNIEDQWLMPYYGN